MKNILITGGCGFIGSNFINYIHSIRKELFIVNYDKIDYCSNSEFISNQISNYVLVKNDLNNKDILITTLKSYNIDTVIHFAAQSHVDNSFGNSIQFTIDNVLGTHNLLECCRVYDKIEKFLHISTDEVYGEVDLSHPGCTEKSLLNPTNPYAATKAGAEFLVRSYFHSYKLPIIITRMNNVVGPGQYPEKLIPKFITALLKDEKCTFHGKGESRRNFIFTDDVSRGIISILEKGEIGEIYNIGTNNEYSVIDIFNILFDLIRPGENKEDYIQYVPDRLFNDFRYNINSENIRKLGWKEETDFMEGIKTTIEYYKLKG
jgi:dTDP-glucose 4,6-dehydratase